MARIDRLLKDSRYCNASLTGTTTKLHRWMSHDNLFGSDDDSDTQPTLPRSTLAKQLPPPTAGSLTCPPIQGLYVFRSLIPLDLQETVLRSIFSEGAVTFQNPQAMLFPRSADAKKDIDACPPFLVPLVEALPQLLKALLPIDAYNIVFNEDLPLQTILNLYEPGQGIAPHVRRRQFRYECFNNEYCTDMEHSRLIFPTAMQSPSLAFHYPAQLLWISILSMHPSPLTTFYSVQATCISSYMKCDTNTSMESLIERSTRT